ncbi:MAG: heavy-metal-associated domain-containing protein [Planctomycetes bacterium]|nr:heavy-metal-associated domain-containing protein [Planctomycetota bacterium]
MRTNYRLLATLGVLTALVLSGAVRAADPVPTKLTVPGLDCMNCAKKAGDKLYAVPGVANVKVDIKAKLLIVMPKQGATISPRSLWEAVDKAGYEPSKLEGPEGTFTAKPTG